MASTSNPSTSSLRSRRSAAQLHALVGVEREIRANDPNGRRKYLRDFNQAFRAYDSVLDSADIRQAVRAADIILIGDYHALPASQNFAASLVQERARIADRPVVLGLETVFSRDQHILDEWLRREIDEEELRERIRFDLDWGYDWTPFYNLLEVARQHAAGIYGLDCMPREDLRKIAARDRHAADKLTELRQRHPEAVILVLFGESHLAPGHLPRLVRERMPSERTLTILQNVDALYWRAAGEPEHVEAVRVADDIICVFNSTPLEKYENYRLHLDRWSREGAGAPDLGPTIYNLIDGLLRFLDINRYASHNGTQPKFLVDLMPEVYCRTSGLLLRRLLSRKSVGEEEKRSMLRKMEERGSAYLPPVNTFYICDFQMIYAAEEAARFLHHACRGLPSRVNGHPRLDAKPLPAEDLFYAHVVEDALAYFGSRVLCPARPPLREADLYDLYDQTHEDLEQQTSFNFADLIRMLDFLVLHRQFELHVEQYEETPKPIQEGIQLMGTKFQYLTRQLGHLLGSDLYDAYLEGHVTRAALRNLFLARLESPGQAREAYFSFVHKLRSGKKRPKSTNGNSRKRELKA
jgi:Haem-binding uptake, Tiki superfamily, ChaN